MKPVNRFNFNCSFKTIFTVLVSNCWDTSAPDYTSILHCQVKLDNPNQNLS